MSELEKIIGRIGELGKARTQVKEQLAQIDSATTELLVRRAELRYGIRPGVIVRCGDQVYRVTQVTQLHFDPPWAMGNPLKKDGTFGTAERNLFKWQVCQDSPPYQIL